MKKKHFEWHEKISQLETLEGDVANEVLAEITAALSDEETVKNTLLYLLDDIDNWSFGDYHARHIIEVHGFESETAFQCVFNLNVFLFSLTLADEYSLEISRVKRNEYESFVKYDLNSNKIAPIHQSTFADNRDFVRSIVKYRLTHFKKIDHATE